MSIALRPAMISVVALLLFSGCSTVSGVRRTIAVSQAPAIAAVDASLRDVPRITDVSFYRSSTANAHIEQFQYRAGDLSGIIEIERAADGHHKLTLYREWKDRRPTREQLDETRALMDAVYASLRRHVPDLPPASEVKEQLIRPPES